MSSIDKYDRLSTTVICPIKLAHVVLRTSPENFQSMVHFYKTFLGATASHENDFLSFLTYDDEHHRVALLAVPGTGKRALKTSGLEHVAFSFATLDDLALAYRQRKSKGIFPIWSVNHGPTTSIYYEDPDGNQIETQFDNFDSNEAASKFMASKEFEENPIGVDFDPEELVQRLRQDEDRRSISKRPNIGPRGIPDDA